MVRANKEVILSAGTIGTAKLLLLSGVGPKNHLQALKVISCGCGNNLMIFFCVNLTVTSCSAYFTVDCWNPRGL